jgi:hypothetical protein
MSFTKDTNYQAGIAKLFTNSGIPNPGEVFFDIDLTSAGQPGYCGGIYIGGDGNLSVIMAQDTTNTTVTFTGLKAGSFLPIQVKRVASTSTATNIMGLW